MNETVFMAVMNWATLREYRVYGVITLSENETSNDGDIENYNYGFHNNMQRCSHYSETLPLILATFIIYFLVSFLFGVITSLLK